MSSGLSSTEQKLLLELARGSIVGHVTDQPVPDRKISGKGVQSQLGCFVTIKTGGELRGCIGNFISDKPLYMLVQEMAASAATRDPRFYPMKAGDLADFELEISVLSPLRKIATPEEIEIGKHGLYLEKNSYRGVLLPQVATEFRWDRETFLAQTCIKAGLLADDWREGAEIFVFTAQVFGEK